MTNAILRGKPDAGNPHVRFDEGEVASAKPRRGSLLYNKVNIKDRQNFITSKYRLFTTMRKQESLKTPAKCNLA